MVIYFHILIYMLNTSLHFINDYYCQDVCVDFASCQKITVSNQMSKTGEHYLGSNLE